MIRMMTTEEFREKVRKINPSFEVLSDYKGGREKVLRKCTICGDVRKVQARMLLETPTHGCPVCVFSKQGKEKRKSPAQFREELFKVNPNIELLSEYEKNDSRVRCKCKIDGYEWDGIPHTLLEGHGCMECYRRAANRRTEDEFLKEMHERFPTIRVLSKYIRIAVKVDFACDACGYHWTAIPDTILNNKNSGCPKCAGRAHISEAEIIDRIVDKNNRVEYIGGYKDMSSHANFRCKKCGYEWHTLVGSILAGRGCPKCNLSHGALRIAKYFDDNGIDYICEFKFDDCRNIRPLPFDFYIKDKNTCIEYDGEQHFEPVKFGDGETSERVQYKFETQQRNDNIKTEYCQNNGIKLIRIPYTDFDRIESILDKHFS